MEGLFTVEALISLITLLVLEIVLGIDNVIFISILSDKLPAADQDRARKIGIGLAVITRVLLLLSISWVISLDEYALVGRLTGKDIVLLVGGLFLIGKSTYEIHEKLEAHEKTQERKSGAAATVGAVVAQIVLIDVVFSLDSVITAVGISDHLPVMITAILVAAVIMLFAAGSVSKFVKEHPTMKILALAFLILIGTMLVIEGWSSELAHELHLKNYAYFAMAFSFLVELVNMRVRQASTHPVELHNQPQLVNGGTNPPTPATKNTGKKKK